MRTNYGVGRYVASEADVLMFPKGYKGGGTIRGVVYVHGAGETAAIPLNAGGNKQNEAQLLAAIASRYPTVMFDAGVVGQGGITDSNNWGNTNGQTRLGQAITWLQTAVGTNGTQNPAGGGAKAGKVALVGISMGHALSLTYAQAHAANVNSIIGILPVNDLDDIRDNDRGAAGYRQSISTAWAAGGQRTDATCGTTSGSATVTDTSITSGDNGKYVTGPGIPANTYVGTVTASTSFLLSSSPTSQVNVNATATATVALNLTARWTAAGTPALPAGANPALTANQTNLLAIPQKLWAANDDAICTIATANALTTNLGAICTLVNMGNSGGHSDASVGAAPIKDVLSFLATYNV